MRALRATYDAILDWPTTLGALTRLLGRRVTVAVGMPGDERGPALVLNVPGTLVGGWDLGVAEENLVGEMLFYVKIDSLVVATDYEFVELASYLGRKSVTCGPLGCGAAGRVGVGRKRADGLCALTEGVEG